MLTGVSVLMVKKRNNKETNKTFRRSTCVNFTAEGDKTAGSSLRAELLQYKWPGSEIYQFHWVNFVSGKGFG